MSNDVSGAMEPADGEETGWSVSAPADQTGRIRRLDSEEFDPIGTVTLILVYVAILAFMWVFMYFVEFLGNELTVIGAIVG
ncbi:MAG: hypothetical protein ABEH56_03895 [Salinirussus sp.]